ncbi:MAG: hypothetical protein F4Y27_06270 [Acidimicrobiaceae bacterium]|nr:hypothetical protein [Acidimicrobiaceae bacterium]
MTWATRTLVPSSWHVEAWMKRIALPTRRSSLLFGPEEWNRVEGKEETVLAVALSRFEVALLGDSHAGIPFVSQLMSSQRQRYRVTPILATELKWTTR